MTTSPALQYSPSDWKTCSDCGVTMPPPEFNAHKPERCDAWTYQRLAELVREFKESRGDF